MQESDRLFAELEPLLAGAGLTLVELSAQRRGASATVRMTIYSARGTGTDECAVAHRLAYPRLQLLLGMEELGLEVASPGIDRALKSPRDWKVFEGKGARVLLKGETEWVRGRIAVAEEERVVLACEGGERAIELEAISKARLDSSREGD